MVAKSYQKFEISSEPYAVNGRMYVKVKTEKGELKQVRWYSEKEYERLYHEDKVVQFTNQKKIFGFDNGYITIFKGNTYPEKEYFKNNSARYCKLWGWYFVSTEKLPEDLPADVEAIRLPWDAIGLDSGMLKPENEVIKIVENMIHDPDPSEFQGEVGDKIDMTLYIERTIALDGYYGPSTMHIMRDENKNCYVWTTTARCLNEETSYHIKGTIKDHREYKNTKQTILTRCKIIEGE